MTTPTLNLSARTAQSISGSVNNPDGNGVTITIEVNRARDFASSDSLYATIGNAPAGSSSFTVDGLPNATPYFMRAITSAGASTWSDTAVTATTEVAPAAYSGFSIDMAELVIPEDISALSLNGGAIVSGQPLANLLIESPTATAQWTGYDASILFMTSGVPIDTIALLGTLAGDSAQWRIRNWASGFGSSQVYDSGYVPFRCSPTVGRRPFYHGIQHLPSPSLAQYWEIATRSVAPAFIARHLIAGLSRRSLNASQGWGQSATDQGSAQRGRFGDLDVVMGWRGRTFDFQMSWLRETEYQTKWADVATRLGTTSPALVIPNSKANVWLNDRVGYGNLTDWRAENVRSSRYSQGVTINSCY